MAKLDSDVVARAYGDWPPLLDALLIGVTHHISNRVATLAGVSDILAGDPSVPPILRALSEEVPRLEESLRLLRLLAVPENEHEEAIEVFRSLADAMAIADLHPACADAHFELPGGADVPPVVAPPVGYMHSLVVALVAAAVRARHESTDSARDADGAHGRDMLLIPVTVVVEGPEVVITVGERNVRARRLGA